MCSNKKILVAGDVLGQFNIFFNRLKILQESKGGPYDMVLCGGSFFSLDGEDNQDANIAKEFNLKLPIYVLGPVIQSQKRYYKPLFDKNLFGVPPFDEGFDIAVNVTYLGKQGILGTPDGIKIVYLSGYESDSTTDFSFDLSEVDKLINNCANWGRIDVLLTSSFPYHVNEHSLSGKSNYLNRMNDNGSMLVSKLAKAILPRYHFTASLDEFYEREPYRNHIILKEQPKLVTRFVSLAKVKKDTKPKWLYAFTLKPAKEMTREEIIKQPDDTTENPYVNIDFDRLRVVKKERVFENGSFFFEQPTNSNDIRRNQNNRDFRQNNGDSSNHVSNNLNKRPGDQDENADKRPRLMSDGACWFCLASPQVDKHLIISIGEYAYLALAKGGLINRHFLIIPIGHYRSIIDLEINPNLSNVLEEIGKYKNAVIDYFNSKEQVAVFFERNFKSGHLQLQVVAVPRNYAQNILNTLEDECKERQFILREMRRGSTLATSLAADRVPYFYIEFQGNRFFIGIKPNKGFPMQFGRELLANPALLNCVDKIDWRNCELDVDAARQLVVETRKEFKNYDFAL